MISYRRQQNVQVQVLNNHYFTYQSIDITTMETPPGYQRDKPFKYEYKDASTETPMVELPETEARGHWKKRNWIGFWIRMADKRMKAKSETNNSADISSSADESRSSSDGDHNRVANSYRIHGLSNTWSTGADDKQAMQQPDIPEMESDCTEDNDTATETTAEESFPHQSEPTREKKKQQTETETIGNAHLNFSPCDFCGEICPCEEMFPDCRFPNEACDCSACLGVVLPSIQPSMRPVPVQPMKPPAKSTVAPTPTILNPKAPLFFYLGKPEGQ
ncbi:hypothetical protein EG328_002577 [Venturia inaequalis]|uniref:Uncharacterized protein n=1 Tax=Venturia inaequalis TaxID=5025 RepID=A0A8H3UVQ9_VENIN|nr:hypothetical protein EG328_002577 [Venturia inaequalis]